MTGKSNSDHRPCLALQTGLTSQNRRNGKSGRARLAMLLLATTAVSVSTSAVADHPASIQRIGRWLGVGWGDGYHVCRDGGIRPGADLPPQSFSEQFGPAKSVGNCGEIFPPGAGLPRQYTTTPTCDHGICDAPPVVTNPIHSHPMVKHPRPDIRAQLPASVPPQPALTDDLNTPPPNWVDRSKSTNENTSPREDEIDQAIEIDQAMLPEITPPNLQGPDREASEAVNEGNRAETAPREVASPSDFVLPTEPAPEPEEELKWDGPTQPDLKPNRLPPVLNSNGVPPDDRNDKSYDLLPPPSGRLLNNGSATGIINSPSNQPPRFEDSLLEDSLLEEDSLIEQPHEFGVPTVKLNPFFETKSRTDASSTGRVITRVAKRPSVTRPRQSTQDSNVIRQPD